jgi:hypothetical protein
MMCIVRVSWKVYLYFFPYFLKTCFAVSTAAKQASSEEGVPLEDIWDDKGDKYIFAENEDNIDLGS